MVIIKVIEFPVKITQKFRVRCIIISFKASQITSTHSRTPPQTEVCTIVPQRVPSILESHVSQEHHCPQLRTVPYRLLVQTHVSSDLIYLIASIIKDKV